MLATRLSAVIFLLQPVHLGRGRAPLQPSVYASHDETLQPLCKPSVAHHRLCLRSQQHEEDLLAVVLLPTGNVVWLASRAVGVVAMRFLISDAIVMNACSTLVADLADVSRNGMESESASSLAV
jgi:hypothetical protein